MLRLGEDVFGPAPLAPLLLLFEGLLLDRKLMGDISLSVRSDCNCCCLLPRCCWFYCFCILLSIDTTDSYTINKLTN